MHGQSLVTGGSPGRLPSRIELIPEPEEGIVSGFKPLLSKGIDRFGCGCMLFHHLRNTVGNKPWRGPPDDLS